jgi:hypothetical protein
MSPTTSYSPARREYVGYLVSVVVLCVVAIASGIAAGVASTLVTIRLLVPHGPSFWHLLRIVVSRALLLLASQGSHP